MFCTLYSFGIGADKQEVQKLRQHDVDTSVACFQDVRGQISLECCAQFGAK